MARRSARPARKKIERFLAQGQKVALEEVETMVRAVLAGKNPAASFRMENGSFEFLDKDGTALPYWGATETPRWLRATAEFIEEYDPMLNITGRNMRIDGPEEPVLTDW